MRIKAGPWPCALLALLALSCANSGGPVVVDVSWNLTCPSSSSAECASWAEDTCLGELGARSISGAHGEMSCNDQDPIIATCEVVQRDELTVINLKATAGDFGFELTGAATDDSGGMGAESVCIVTITEDGVDYGRTVMLGSCGREPPSVEQPCQISNVMAEAGVVAFDLQCDALLNSTSGLGFDVSALSGQPTISFSNCSGF